MKQTYLTLTSLLAASALGLSSASAVIVYSETFDNTGTGNISLDNATGWKAAWGASGTAFDNTSNSTAASNPVISDAASSEGTTDGYLFSQFFDSVTNNPNIFYVDGLNLGSPVGGEVLDTVSFALRNEDIATDFHIVLEFGAGNWFLGDSTFNNTTTNVWTTDLTLDLSTETWKALTVDVGTEISVGAIASLPSLNTSSLTGIGFYADIPDQQRIRIDTLEVNAVAAVPEPSTYAALAGALALGFVMLRRRRS